MRIAILGALSSKEVNNRTPSKVVVDYLQNVHEMCRAASIVRKKGHVPFTPVLDLLLGVVGDDWEEEDYRGLTTEFIKVCEAVVVISRSWGVERDLETARQYKCIIYNSLEEVPDVKEGLC